MYLIHVCTVQIDLRLHVHAFEFENFRGSMKFNPQEINPLYIICIYCIHTRIMYVYMYNVCNVYMYNLCIQHVYVHVQYVLYS